VNDPIIDAVADAYAVALPWIGRVYGPTKRVLVSNDPRPKYLPIAESVRPDPDDCGFRGAVVPDAKYTGTIHFETISARVATGITGRKKLVGRFRLVAWFNLRKIGAVSAATLTDALIGALPAAVATGGAPASLTLSAIPPASPSPFERYDYDDEALSFLRPPYVSTSVEIQYVAFLPKNCPVPVELNPEVC